MDWLIDSRDPGLATRQAMELLEEHLKRHAVEPAEVSAAVGEVPQIVEQAARSAEGRHLHVRLEWTSAQPVLEVSTLDDGHSATAEVPVGQPVSARHRAMVRALPHQRLTSRELPVVRRSQHTFEAGPPPVAESTLDPETQGAATVAIALATAIEAHPSASAPQAAAIAGALIANAGVGDDQLSGETVAESFVRLHAALGSEAYVVAVDDDRVELAVTRCPFVSPQGAGSSLCHVSSGLAGQLAAKVHGKATVLLDETLVSGDPECHLQVLLRPEDTEKGEGQPYYWPPRAAKPVDTVPHLDLSVALPRESVSVPVVRRLAAQALQAFGVLDEDVHDVQLAITEACANVIDHAGATDTYDVKVELSANRCAITVVDQGGGFDVGEVPDRPDDDSEMGRGVALMRALVDNVAFRNEPQAGAVVHMVKSLRYLEDHPLRRS